MSTNDTYDLFHYKHVQSGSPVRRDKPRPQGKLKFPRLSTRLCVIAFSTNLSRKGDGAWDNSPWSRPVLLAVTLPCVCVCVCVCVYLYVHSIYVYQSFVDKKIVYICLKLLHIHTNVIKFFLFFI